MALGDAMVVGLGQHAALFPLTLLSFSACEAKFLLPVAVEVLCGAKQTWATGRRRLSVVVQQRRAAFCN